MAHIMLVYLKGTVIFLYIYSRRILKLGHIRCKPHHVLRFFELQPEIASSQKKTGHRQSPQMGTQSPEYGTRFPK